MCTCYRVLYFEGKPETKVKRVCEVMMKGWSTISFIWREIDFKLQVSELILFVLLCFVFVVKHQRENCYIRSVNWLFPLSMFHVGLLLCDVVLQLIPTGLLSQWDNVMKWSLGWIKVAQCTFNVADHPMCDIVIIFYRHNMYQYEECPLADRSTIFLSNFRWAPYISFQKIYAIRSPI